MQVPAAATMEGVDATPGKPSVAKRRRQQHDRACGRHLAWALKLMQAGAMHHTGLAAVELQHLKDQLDAQHHQLANLSHAFYVLAKQVRREPG